ncbi:MAG: hypothetical protein I8H91_15040 [Burkholderiales bacterium]|nr:hypothetical protein [Burkholderiales bacterium]
MRFLHIERAARKVLVEPDAEFRALARIGRQARMRGYYTRSEFLRICKWKSGRHIGLCQLNTERQVQAATRRAFSASSEQAQMEALLTLKGVAVPRASALLAAADPKRFGVIDIRAWQFLHGAGAVSRNKAGRGLSINNWLDYLPVIRSVASIVGTSPRLVELALYKAHKKASKGRPLYGGKGASLKCQSRIRGPL